MSDLRENTGVEHARWKKFVEKNSLDAALNEMKQHAQQQAQEQAQMQANAP